QADTPHCRSVSSQSASYLDVHLPQQVGLHGFAIYVIWNFDGGERRQLDLRIGEQLQTHRLDPLPQVRPGCRVALAALGNALFERMAQGPVQGVDLQDRRRVVVGDRPLDPVLLEQVEVERVRDRELARAGTLHRARRDGQGRKAGWRADALLRAG